MRIAAYAITILLALLMTVALVTVAYFVGGIAAQRQLYQRQTVEEQKLIEPLIREDDWFADVEMGPRSNGGVELYGSVPSEEAHGLLKSSLVKAVGESRTEELMLGIRLADTEEDMKPVQ